MIYFVLKKNAFWDGITIFNRLPPSMTILNSDKANKAALRKYLHTHPFYSR